MINYQVYTTDLLSEIAKLIDSGSISGDDAIKMIRDIISLESLLDNTNKEGTFEKPYNPYLKLTDQIIMNDFHSKYPDNSSSISVRPVEQPIVYSTTSAKTYE